MKQNLIRAALVILLIVAAIGLRVAVLFHNSRKLTDVSAKFARDYTVGHASCKQLVYVVLGDSTVAGTGVSSVRETLPYLIAGSLTARGLQVHVVNLAVTGAQMADVIRVQLPQLAQLHPDMISLNCGANDATHSTPPAQFRRELARILSALGDTPAKTILVATTPDLGTTPALKPLFNRSMGRRAAAQNVVLSELSAGTRIQIVDLYGRGKLIRSALYAADDFHPDAAGYERWAGLYEHSK